MIPVDDFVETVNKEYGRLIAALVQEGIKDEELANELGEADAEDLGRILLQSLDKPETSDTGPEICFTSYPE